jgi:ribulose kinase
MWVQSPSYHLCFVCLNSRAMMEAVAFGTELILENMRQGGYHPDSLTLAGGPLWKKPYLLPAVRTYGPHPDGDRAH